MQHSRFHKSALICSFFFLLAGEIAAQPNWSLNPAEYQFSMLATAQLYIDGMPDHAPGNIIAVYAGDELRGVSTPVSISGQAFYFLTIYAHTYSTDTLTFKAYIAATDAVYTSPDSVAFKHNTHLGKIEAPRQLHFEPGAPPADPIISGTVFWEHDDATGVGNTVVALTGGQTGSMTTPVAGTYAFTVAPGSNYTVTPTKTINKLNGVTTADVTRIQQHVTNVNPITDPYKFVAADVNKSNSISTLDATIINQALLGNPAALAQFKTSWRFVSVAHPMTIPPWGFPEKITLNNVQNNVPDQDFFGIKTGDVVTPHTNPANFGGGKTTAFVLHAPEQALQSGEQISITFSAGRFSDLAALQFALKFDVEKLTFTGIEPLDGLPVSVDNFGLYNISEGEIRVVWSQAEGLFVEAGAPVFKLTFNVLETGGLFSEALRLADEVLENHAYTSALTDYTVQLHFPGTTSLGVPNALAYPALLQNQPNPFATETAIGFVLPEACAAQLRVFDATGWLLWLRDGEYPAGHSVEKLRLDGLKASGVLFYELTTPFGTVTKRMVRVGN